MQKGKIIFLNGVSSSGKTTVAKTLQKKLTKPYCLLSVDEYLHKMDEWFLNDQKWLGDGGIEWIWKALECFHKSIKLFSDVGLNVIADHVVQKQSWLDECLDLLRDNDVLFVHVTCPVEELNRREKERGDRQIGQGESQLEMLLPKSKIYDITVDTFSSSKEECADEIIKLLDQPENFKAFETLRAGGGL
ncbi:MAG: chloramphenicol phosphotransferase CPT family protein [Defluviitaleaceae bacterium]|nr:chloramphenicol phosphotransferase CPT family protein [Defluviitaleaceae bacterium]